jgi:hypothetical protein
MHDESRSLMLAGVLVVAALAGPRSLPAQGRAGATASVTIEKPKPRTAAGGFCRILSDGTLTASWGRSDLPLLGFTIGPHAAMGEEMHASKTPFTGPGRYANEIVAVYLGNTALVDSYGGLGTVVFNADGHTGTFVTNDGKASGHFDCGAAPRQ